MAGGLVTGYEALFEPAFTQMPDNSHQPQNAAQSTGDATTLEDLNVLAKLREDDE